MGTEGCNWVLTVAVWVQLVATANAFVWTFIAMPHLPQDHAVAMRVCIATPGRLIFAMCIDVWLCDCCKGSQCMSLRSGVKHTLLHVHCVEVK